MGNPILLFFSYTMEGIIILHYSSELFNPKFGKRRIMLCLILLYIFLFFISLLNIPLLNLTLFSIFNYIYFYFLFSVSWYGAAFHTSVFTGFMSMSEYVSMTFLKYLSPTFLTDENNFSSLLIFAVVNKMIFFTFVYLLKIFLTNWSKDNYQRDKSSLLLVFFPLVSSIIMGALLSLTLDIILTPMQNFILTLTCLLMMTSCLFIFIANQHNQQKYEELTAIKLQLQKEESLAMYYQMLDEQNENHFRRRMCRKGL